MTGTHEFSRRITQRPEVVTGFIEPWQVASYGTDITDVDTDTYFGVQFTKDTAGFVHIRGAAKATGEVLAGTPLITLPIFYRPDRTLIFTVSYQASFTGNITPTTVGSFGWLEINVAGEIYMPFVNFEDQDMVSLSGIMFFAEN